MQLTDKTKFSFDASSFHVGLVVSRFNENITSRLRDSAIQALTEDFQVPLAQISVVSVAGAVEIPFALQRLAQTRKFQTLAALGCVIQGETPHFDYVCAMVQQGVLRVSLDENIPIGFGLITVNNQAQAEARTHLGAEAVAAALELTRIKI